MRTDSEALNWYRTASEESLGRFGESVWSNIFKASGVLYIPLAKIECGGAPKVEGSSTFTVLPDFDCSAESWSLFIDSKCKSGPVLYRKAKQYRHGIDKRNYQAYRRAAEMFRKRAGIAIVELFTDAGQKSEWSGRLMAESFNNIGQPIDGYSNQEHMVYWPCKVFSDLTTLGPLELMRVARGECVPSLKLELEQIFAKQKQLAMF